MLDEKSTKIRLAGAGVTLAALAVTAGVVPALFVAVPVAATAKLDLLKGVLPKSLYNDNGAPTETAEKKLAPGAMATTAGALLLTGNVGAAALIGGAAAIDYFQETDTVKDLLRSVERKFGRDDGIVDAEITEKDDK